MKILITTGIFRPEFGGPATMAVELASRLQAAGHTVTVITYSDKPYYDFDAEYNFKLVRVVRSSKLANYAKYFFAVLRHTFKNDCIYSLDWFSAGMPVCAAAFVAGKKYAVRVGGGYIWEKYLAEGRPPVTLRQFYERGLYRQYNLMYMIIKIVLRRAEKVVFNSDIQKELYITYYGLKPQKTAAILNAVPEYMLSTLMKSYNKTQGLDVRDKEIVFVGRFIKMKNVESLIQAFARLDDYSYKLLLIGEGPAEKILHELVDRLEISHRVIFIKPMSQDEVFKRISNCAYAVIPSWTDVSPHQAYEYLAHNIPFLLTKENYLSINKEDFLKIDPSSVDDIAEKMNWLLVSKNYDSFRKSLAKIKFTHSWDDVLAEHLELFKTLT